MFNKTLVFCLVAVLGAIAPGAAFARQYQDNQQDIYQHGQAEGYGNTVVNSADQLNIQKLNRVRNGYSCSSGGSQGQSNRQNVRQSGGAYGESNTVANRANQRNIQRGSNYTQSYGGCH